MAWVVPLAMVAASFIKSKMDSDSAESQDDAMRAAGAEKLRVMREGAGQVEGYRQSLTPQMMQAMQNQMAQYGGARNVLSQMYGGGGGGSGGPPPPTQPGFNPGQRQIPRGRIFGQTALERPGLPMPAQLMGRPYEPPPPTIGIGFGGEVPQNPLSTFRRLV